jgi:hypothetical protein
MIFTNQDRSYAVGAQFIGAPPRTHAFARPLLVDYTQVPMGLIVVEFTTLGLVEVIEPFRG